MWHLWWQLWLRTNADETEGWSEKVRASRKSPAEKHISIHSFAAPHRLPPSDAAATPFASSWSAAAPLFRAALAAPASALATCFAAFFEDLHRAARRTCVATGNVRIDVPNISIKRRVRRRGARSQGFVRCTPQEGAGPAVRSSNILPRSELTHPASRPVGRQAPGELVEGVHAPCPVPRPLVLRSRNRLLAPLRKSVAATDVLARSAP